MNTSARRLIAGLFAAGFTSIAGASGFALIEQNASGMGNAYAGQAATAQDASTVYFNPAGLARLPGRQAVIAGHAILPTPEFANSATTIAPLQVNLGGNGGTAGELAFVPNLYLSWQVNQDWFAGLGLNAPFGLKTGYDANWAGRFHAIESSLKTINVNPSVAYRLSDAVSLGAGLSFQKADAKLSNAVNYSAAAFAAGGAPLLAAIGGAGQEGVGLIKGDDSTWGYNLGALFNLGEDTRIGLSYRSSVKHQLKGTVAFTNRPALLAGGIPDGAVTATLKLPASASWSLFHRYNERWDLLADISWTQWSSIRSLDIYRDTGALLSTTPLNWRNTYRLSLGANHRYSETWTLRLGIAYDQSPVPDFDRTPRVPDNDRTWFSVGAQYNLSKDDAIDFGYTYIYLISSTVNLCSGANAAAYPTTCSGKNALAGSFSGNINLLSVQYRRRF